MSTGIQKEGESPDSIKQMALRAFFNAGLKGDIDVADIGAGRGNLVPFVLPHVTSLTLVDDFDPKIQNEKVNFLKANLNGDWSLPSNRFDFVFSLEVIEHLENPRHFFREIKRILKPGGFAFVSTPNNSNFFSRLVFLLKGENRYFQDNSYPAHITCLVRKDLKRLATENALELINFFSNGEDVIPVIGLKIRFPFEATSNSFGALFRKPFD